MPAEVEVVSVSAETVVGPETVASPETVDFRSAMAALGSLDTALKAGSPSGAPARVDLATLRHFDSSALAVLLELHRRCRDAGRSFEAIRPPEHLRELAEVYGVDDLLFRSRPSPPR